MKCEMFGFITEKTVNQGQHFGSICCIKGFAVIGKNASIITESIVQFPVSDEFYSMIDFSKQPQVKITVELLP